MNFNEYQKAAKKTAVYPKDQGIVYCSMGLAGEAGEILNKVKKELRGDYDAVLVRYDMNKKEPFLSPAGEKVADELGDVLWYLALLADELGVSLGDIAHRNIAKLKDRAERNQIKGSGDNR